MTLIGSPLQSQMWTLSEMFRLFLTATAVAPTPIPSVTCMLIDPTKDIQRKYPVILYPYTDKTNPNGNSQDALMDPKM